MQIVNKALILSLLMVTVALAGCLENPTSNPAIDDTDGDGVVDASDLCPNTPPNTFVDSNGCEAPCPDFKVWDDLRDEFDAFGYSVETDGVSVIVGAAGDDTAAQNGGKAFIYICGSNGWELQAELVPNIVQQDNDNFGHQVAILGEYAIVGAPNSDVVDSNGNTLTNAGVAYIFGRDSTGAWTQQVMLIEDTPNENARFGWSVDLGNTESEPTPNFDIPSGQYNAAVGAPRSNAVTGYITGAAYFYTTDSSGNEFAHTIRLEANAQWHDGSQCTACMPFSGPWNWAGYGIDVAIYKTTVVVGSSLENVMLLNSIDNSMLMSEKGAIYVFDQITMTPGVHAIQETVRINTPDAEYCYPPDHVYTITLSYGQVVTWNNCNNNAYFGRSVDIYDDTIVVGAPGAMTWSCWGSVKGINGSVYIFEKTNNGWDENAYVRLTPSINYVYNYLPPRQDFTFTTHAFGWEVSIYRDIVLVGSPVRSFHHELFHIGSIEGNGPSDGDSYLFDRTAPLTWNEVAILSIPDIIRAPGYTGWLHQEQGIVHHELAIGGRYVILGSPNDDVRPVNWVPFQSSWYSTSRPYWATPTGGWPADRADFSQGGEDTGSAYICHYDENNQVYCDWSDDVISIKEGTFTWGRNSNANDSGQNNSTMEWPMSECPYEDKMMCVVMGYLYDEVSAEYWQNWENLPNCTEDSRNYSLNGSDVYFSDYESMLILSSCLNPMDDTGNGTGDNNSNNSNDGGDLVRGCTDPEAENYDPEATRDDDSCTYKGEEESESDNSQES